MKKGLNFERVISQEFHSEGIPLCIHPTFLRSRGAGQVDLCRIIKGKREICLEIKEVKSSYLIHKNQLKRLKDSCQLLSGIFNLNCYLDISFGAESSTFNGG